MSVITAMIEPGSAAAGDPSVGLGIDGGTTTAGDIAAPDPEKTVESTRRIATPTYENAPIRATAEDVAGFGPLVTLVAVVLTGWLAARRRAFEP